MIVPVLNLCSFNVCHAGPAHMELMIDRLVQMDDGILYMVRLLPLSSPRNLRICLVFVLAPSVGDAIPYYYEIQRMLCCA